MTSKQLATVLASLRLFQRDMQANTHNMYLHFEDEDPLTADEIDELCEELNV